MRAGHVQELPDEAERAWLIEGLTGLVRQRGWEHLVCCVLVAPDEDHFPERWTGDEEGLRRLALRLLRYAGLEELDAQVEIFDRDAEQTAEETNATAAWFAGILDGTCRFGASARHLGDPLAFTAALAHEVAHAYRAHHQLAVDDHDEEERLTDLTTIYLGFGILTANATARHRSHGADGSQGQFGHAWSFSSLGYLSPQSMSFGLACFARARWLERSERKAVAALLEPNQAHYFRQAYTLLDEERPLLPVDLGIPDPSRWPPVYSIDDGPDEANGGTTGGPDWSKLWPKYAALGAGGLVGGCLPAVTFKLTGHRPELWTYIVPALGVAVVCVGVYHFFTRVQCFHCAGRLDYATGRCPACETDAAVHEQAERGA